MSRRYGYDPEEIRKEESYPQRRIKRWSDEAIHAAARAKGPGTRIEWSDQQTLMIDLDGGIAAVDVFLRQLNMLRDTMPADIFGEVRIRPSRSEVNHHITVKLTEEVGILQRILLQALLGSDIKREALSYAGLLQGQANPIVLFRPEGSE